jgi:hypothetical protein
MLSISGTASTKKSAKTAAAEAAWAEIASGVTQKSVQDLISQERHANKPGELSSQMVQQPLLPHRQQKLSFRHDFFSFASILPFQLTFYFSLIYLLSAFYFFS